MLSVASKQRLSEIVGQAEQILIVLLADVLGELTARSPRDVPRGGPGLGVGTGIVDGHLVMERVLVAPREFLDDVEQISVWMSRVVNPRRLVDPDHVDHERVALPVADGMSE